MPGETKREPRLKDARGIEWAMSRYPESGQHSLGRPVQQEQMYAVVVRGLKALEELGIEHGPQSTRLPKC